MTKKVLIRIAKWSAGILLLIITIIEIVLRISYSEKLRLRSYPQIYMPHEDYGYVYIPNKEAKICVPSICKDFQINSQGFYGNEFSTRKALGKFRIAVVGSSQSTGIWMMGDKTFCMRLEEMCRSVGMDSIEVINCAVDGKFRGVFNARLLIDKVSKYQPDLVLFNCEIPFVHGKVRREVYRDFVIIYDGRKNFFREKSQHYIDYIQSQYLLKFFYSISYIVRGTCRWYMNHHADELATLLRTYVERKFQDPDIRFLPWSVKNSVALLQQVRDTIDSVGGRLVLFDFVPNSYHQTIFGKYGLDYMSLLVPSIPKFIHADDAHFNSDGHQEIAKQTFHHLFKFPEFEEIPVQSTPPEPLGDMND